MANIMSLQKLKNNPSRNGFDLSRKVAYTAKISELLPVECIECIPGDSFKIRKQHFTRTMPVNTAAYTRIREYYDWFFVPTNLLWNKFNTFVSQMTDNAQQATSIADNAVIPNQHPYFTSTQIETYLQKVRPLPITEDTNPNTSERYNIFGYDRALQTAKLLQYLGYGNYYNAAGDNTQDAIGLSTVLNPFPLLAYQKIYQDYFRNSQWENSYAPSWNVNYLDSSVQIPVEDVALDVENMFDLRYSNWNKDFFMGLMPNSQFGSPASVDVSSFSGTVPAYITTSTTSGQLGIDTGGRIVSNSNAAWRLSIIDSLPYTLTSSYTILALRQAEAAQKWKEITQSTQQDYKAQMEAHFGVSLSDAYSERCKFIDGQVSNLDISEVVNSNLAADDSAVIRGKGVGVGDGYINFETKVHGYLMCIYHAVPLLDYQISGVRKRNLKTLATDYAIPEFDKTGMVKVPFIELYNTNSDIIETVSQIQLGYAPQYYEYKVNYDEILGGFVNGGLTQWVAPFDDSYLTTYFQNLSDLNISELTYHFFKINPGVLNPIFVNQITQLTSGNAYDQLLINCSFDVKAVRNLDRNGLPY